MARILIIDDDKTVRTILRQFLEREGFDVVDAPDGNLGVKLFREQGADLIITDLIMPDKEGIEIITELRQDSTDVKIIAISGGGSFNLNEMLPVAKALGANATLLKPFEREELLEAVGELLE